MALRNFTQFTPQTVLSATDFVVGYRDLDEIRTSLDNLAVALSGLLVKKGFTPGNSLGSVVRVGYRYTIASGNNLNAVSGTDDYGSNLIYVPGQIEVYRNGSHLVESLDFQATNGTQIRNLSTLNLGDVVEVSCLSGIVATVTTNVSVGGNAFYANYRYTVATGNTIVPGVTLISGSDDYNAILNFVAPNLEVYLNGSHLVRDYDYGLYSTGSSLTLAAPVANGDVLDVVVLSGSGLTVGTGVSAYSNITRIVAGKNISISPTTGTGVVTVSSKTSLDDIPVPGWTNGDHITKWTTLQLYLSAVAETNTSPASAVFFQNITSSLISNQTQSALYGGSVLAPNGKIYFLPNYASSVMILDPFSETFTTFAIPYTAQNRQYIRGVFHPNGKIYCAPDYSSFGLIIDPSNNTCSTFGNFFEGSGVKDINFWGAAVAPNGRIYPANNRTTWYHFIDPNLTTSTIVGTFAGLPKVVNTAEAFAVNQGCVLGTNGKIYYIPSDASSMFRFVDPATNTLGSITNLTFSTGCYWEDGVLATNGKIYCTTNFGSNRYLAVIDPATDTVSTYNVNPQWSGKNAFMAPNGKLYAINNTQSVLCVLDPDSLSCTTFFSSFFANVGGSQISLGGTLAPNGKYYTAPYYGTSVISLNFLNKNNWNMNVLTNPFFNR